MARPRRVALPWLVLVAFIGPLFGGLVTPPGPAPQPELAVSGASDAMAAAVTWPPSGGLVIAEVVTGGTSASDEYVEVANGGSVPVDVAGLEIVYVTSSGGTVTRKASWSTPLLLEPGRHLLVANTSGSFATVADATYSGGFAATGGALVLRPVGGAPIDAVGWGDATNGFVEGVAAPAPPPGSSIERLPGGAAGNGQDTNVNATDFFVNAFPVPQSLAAPPAPGPSPSPNPSPEPSPSPSPSAEPSPSPSPSPEPSPNPEPSPSPSPDPSPSPSPSPDPSPDPTPPPSPSPEPSPSPLPSPTPSVTPIATARLLSDGATVTVEGTLTTALGAVESGRGAFLQDASGGIALYLDAPALETWPAGSLVRAGGPLDDRYGQRTIRVTWADLVLVGTSALPAPEQSTTGGAGEDREGRRLTVAGTVTEAPSSLTDGLGLTVDDGSGPLRVVVAAGALGEAHVSTGSTVVATGPLGQRDSSGTGSAGYRLFVTLPGELLVVAPSPSPSPSPTPSPSPSPSPSAEPSPGPSLEPSPEPSPSPVASPSSEPSRPPGGVSIVEARALPIGTTVRVTGVVTAEAGRLGHPALLAIEDATAGIVIHLADGLVRPSRGELVDATGTLAEPNGQLELRVTAGGWLIAGSGALPAPSPAAAADLGEATEARLLTLEGTVAAAPRRSASGDIAVDVIDAAGGRVRVMADTSSGVASSALRSGTTYRLTGVVGQRASRKGRLDGYRLWLRDPSDIAQTGAPSPSASADPSADPSPDPSATAAATGGPPTAGAIPIATAIFGGKGAVTIEAVVTAGPALLDGTGRRIVVQDASAAIEVLLPADAAAPAVGDRIRATGSVGRAYGAPRLRAQTIMVEGRGLTTPRGLARAPGPADEWWLVRVGGTVESVRRLGDRWRAELRVGKVRVAILGLAGAAIPASTLIEGRRATVTGIVRRPYPSASDRRFAIVPRGPADLAVGPPAEEGEAPSAGTPRDQEPASDPLDADLDGLADRVGATVRVGGLVLELVTDGFVLDDGTAHGRVVLTGAAGAYLPLIEPGDALNAIGRVEGRGEAARVVVRDPAAIVRAGDLGDLGDLGASGESDDQADPDDPGRPLDVDVEADEPSPGDDPTADGPDTMARTAGLAPGGFVEPTLAGLGSLAAVSAVSLAIALARRRRLERLVARRVAARIAGLARERRR